MLKRCTRSTIRSVSTVIFSSPCQSWVFAGEEEPSRGDMLVFPLDVNCGWNDTMLHTEQRYVQLHRQRHTWHMDDMTPDSKRYGIGAAT